MLSDPHDEKWVALDIKPLETFTANHILIPVYLDHDMIERFAPYRHQPRKHALQNFVDRTKFFQLPEHARIGKHLRRLINDIREFCYHGPQVEHRVSTKLHPKFHQLTAL